MQYLLLSRKIVMSLTEHIEQCILKNNTSVTKLVSICIFLWKFTMKFRVTLMVLLGVACVNASSILFWFPFSFKSGMIAYMPIVEELAKKGHKVILFLE